MAQATLQEMGREVHLYSGGVCPILLAERWVRDRYRKACERQIWSFKVGRGAFGTTDVYNTGTITLTNGTSIVDGSGTTFIPSMTGLQLRTSGFVFNISSYLSSTQLLLQENWLGPTTSSLSFDIVTAYITPTPLDFHAFYSVIDPSLAWKLHLGFNARDLDRIDARRSASGTPRILANGVYNIQGTPTFELWPHATTQKMYTYTYEKRMPDLSSSDTPPKIMRSDVLVKGALADLARWPGTPERKNPMFDPYFNQWKIREMEFEQELAKLIVEDQSILQTDLSSGATQTFAPLDAKFMQSHAF